VAGDGSVWFAEDEVDRMARIDRKTGKIEEFPIPFKGRALPRRMNSDAEGNLWVALWTGNKLMKLDYRTKAMTIFTPPTPNAGNYSVHVDKKNNIVWVSEQKVDLMARFDPKTGTWLEFPFAEAESDARRIEIDPTNPNRVFFSGNTADRIGFVEYLPDDKRS
jgi:streptogramin lyase